jgi:hypothetical protein
LLSAQPTAPGTVASEGDDVVTGKLICIASRLSLPRVRRVALSWPLSGVASDSGTNQQIGDIAMMATERETAGICAASRHAPGLGITDWLALAAAPTFAVMALLTGVLGDTAPDMVCSAAHGASPLSGMVPMYLLMSAFHSAPWLKLLARRRSMVSQQGSR